MALLPKTYIFCNELNCFNLNYKQYDVNQKHYVNAVKRTAKLPLHCVARKLESRRRRAFALILS